MGYVDEVLDIVSKKNADQLLRLTRKFTERTLFLKELQSQIVRSCSEFLG